MCAQFELKRLSQYLSLINFTVNLFGSHLQNDGTVNHSLCQTRRIYTSTQLSIQLNVFSIRTEPKRPEQHCSLVTFRFQIGTLVSEPIWNFDDCKIDQIVINYYSMPPVAPVQKRAVQ